LRFKKLAAAEPLKPIAVEDSSPASILAFFMKNHFTIEMLQSPMLDVIDSGKSLDAPQRNEAEHRLYEELHNIFSPQIYSIYDSYGSKSPSSLPDSTGDSTMSLRHILYLMDDLSLLGTSQYQMEICDVISYFAGTLLLDEDDSLYWAEMELVPLTLFDTIFHFAKKIAETYLENIGVDQKEIQRAKKEEEEEKEEEGDGIVDAISSNPELPINDADPKKRLSNVTGSKEGLRTRSNTVDKMGSKNSIERADSSNSKGKNGVEFAVDSDRDEVSQLSHPQDRGDSRRKNQSAGMQSSGGVSGLSGFQTQSGSRSGTAATNGNNEQVVFEPRGANMDPFDAAREVMREVFTYIVKNGVKSG
jgi:hypothetical protein